MGKSHVCGVQVLVLISCSSRSDLIVLTHAFERERESILYGNVGDLRHLSPLILV